MNIVIIAREKRDPVIRNLYFWIKELGHQPFVIYVYDLLNTYKFSLKIQSDKIDFRIVIGKTILHSENVDLFFLRHEIFQSTANLSDEERFRIVEFNATMEYFCSYLKFENKIIGYCSQLSNNKLYQLTIAKKNGFQIPETLVTNLNEELQEFKRNNSLVSKAIQGVFLKKKDTNYVTNYTRKVLANEETDKTMLRLFQSEIPKALELRVFVIFDSVFCVASTSTEFDEEIDIRVLMAQRRVEYFEYQLPQSMKDKLIDLRKGLEIDSYSADIIMSSESRYYLVDVNPYGQISMLAQTKIHNLEKLIAIKIIGHAEEKKRVS